MDAKNQLASEAATPVSAAVCTLVKIHYPTPFNLLKTLVTYLLSPPATREYPRIQLVETTAPFSRSAPVTRGFPALPEPIPSRLKPALPCSSPRVTLPSQSHLTGPLARHMRSSLACLWLTAAALSFAAPAPSVRHPQQPLHFEPLPDGRFALRGARTAGAISATRLTLPGAASFEFANANPHALLSPENPLPSHSNYFSGAAASALRVPHYARLRVRNAYPGIDVLFYSNAAGELEYDLLALPHASLSPVALSFDQPASLNPAGELLAGSVRHHRPRVFQSGRELSARYHLDSSGRRARFLLDSSYDPARPLTIDPVLTFSTYLGGAATDEITAVTLDAAGSLYVTGNTSSRDFPISKPLSPAAGSAFVSKFTRNGDQLVLAWSTYFGGNGNDLGEAITVDADGFVYVGGRTLSTNFPTRAQIQTDQPLWDGFLIKFKQPGDTTPISIEWSTYLGGRDEDRLFHIAVDASGAVYAAGQTYSSNFPAVKSFQPYSDNYDAFVTKLRQPGPGSPNLTIEWSTLLGGSNAETTLGFALDRDGNVYLAGDTYSSNFPVKDSLARHNYQDVFLTKLIPPAGDGNVTLAWSTIIGGGSSNWGQTLAVDGCGAVYVAGRTLFTRYPAVKAFQPELKGGQDAFVTKINTSPEGKPVIEWSTFLGGELTDQALSIAVDNGGSVYVAGETASKDFPVRNALQDSIGGTGASPDAWIAKLIPPADGSPNVTLDWSTYWGGSDRDFATRLALDSLGNIFLSGVTNSTDLKLQNAFQTARTNSNGLLAAFQDPTADVTIDSEPSKLSFTINDATCNTRTLTTPATVKWLGSRPYRISFEKNQSVDGADLVFANWDDDAAVAEPSRAVTAPASGAATYKIKFAPPPAP